MTSRIARATPRIPYHAQLEVGRDSQDAEGVVTWTEGRSLNLGLGGLAFECGEPFGEGQRLQCQLRVGGLTTRLLASVAWTAPGATARTRYGVRFERLPDRERRLLHQVVTMARAGGRPITLHFPDMNRQVEARAMAEAGGLRVSAPFPMLAEGTRVTLDPGLGADTMAYGAVTSVALDQHGPVPVLEFRIALARPHRQESRSAFPARIGDPRAAIDIPGPRSDLGDAPETYPANLSRETGLDAASPGTVVEAPEVAIPDLPPGTVDLPADRAATHHDLRRRTRWLAAALLAGLLLLAGLWTWSGPARPRPQSTSASDPHRSAHQTVP